jgi:hypothetical protein
MNRILTFALAASLLSAPVMAAPSRVAPPSLDPNEPYKITKCKNAPDGKGWCDLVTLASAIAPELGRDPRGRTQLAMKCWLGLVGYQGCWKGQGEPCLGNDGPVEKVEYLGSTNAGADIYQVRYRFRIMAFRVALGPAGNADQYLVKAADRYWVKREMSPRAAPILIYARPENAPPASGCGASMLPPQW